VYILRIQIIIAKIIRIVAYDFKSVIVEFILSSNYVSNLKGRLIDNLLFYCIDLYSMTT